MNRMKSFCGLLLVAGWPVGWVPPAGAQGVLLSAGNSLAIEFNGVDGCHFTEAAPGAVANVVFGVNLLGPGESLRLELFENSLNETPFASQVFNPATSLTHAAVAGPMSQWLDYQGLVQVSVLSGSASIVGAGFFVSPNTATYCDTFITVPEPNAFGFGSLIGCHFAIVLFHRRRHAKADARVASCAG